MFIFLMFQEGKTVLHLAVEKGNETIVKLILAKDPDKEICDKVRKGGSRPIVVTRACYVKHFIITYYFIHLSYHIMLFCCYIIHYGNSGMD